MDLEHTDNMDKKRYHIPTHDERIVLRRAIKEFVARGCYVPPLSIERLTALAEQLLTEQAMDMNLCEWTMVEMHNRIWLPTLAAIPYERRILLLPKCLSNSTKCCAEIDEVGLLCHRCGNCHIPTIEDKAAELGIMSIVAEGFTSVINLIKTGVVDAIIGVSCLDSLEKAFPLLVNNAVPGVAVPLNIDGCKDTNVDVDFVMELMAAKEQPAAMVDYDSIEAKVSEWFSVENIMRHHFRDSDSSSRIALDWLAGNGKRWRPYLFTASYSALAATDKFSSEIERVAIAIEAFHKASLVHDDIEDNDAERYGRPTINSQYGTPIAINVGDMLLGIGYRLLGECGQNNLTAIIADAHIALSRGQGMELEWCGNPHAVGLNYVLDIFRLKTSPAFEVSLLLGVACAGAEPSLTAPLRAYSTALGIAYQLYDDIEDFRNDERIELRPSAVFALLCELCPDEEFIRAMIASDDIKSLLRSEPYRALLDEALERVEQMAVEYRKRSLDILEAVSNVELKRLLYRLTAKILK